jgi:ATP-binding cassette subfamily B protein
MPNSSTSPASRLTGRIVADLARAIWRYRQQTVLSLLLMVAAKLAIIMIPLVLKHIVDELSHPAAQALFPGFPGVGICIVPLSRRCAQ